MELVLRFSARVAKRVTATNWHESQEIRSLGDGAVELSLVIAEPTEIRSWILGWGQGRRARHIRGCSARAAGARSVVSDLHAPTRAASRWRPCAAGPGRRFRGSRDGRHATPHGLRRLALFAHSWFEHGPDWPITRIG